MAGKSSLVSIIIPCYNQSRYLDDNIRSICRDTHKDVEIIIVNDGSTDADYRTVEGNMRKIGGARDVQVINQVNGGLSQARNAGIARATGKYIQLLDADDMIANNKLALQVGAMETEGLDISLCDYMMCNSDRSSFWPAEQDTIGKFEFDFQTLVTSWERGYSIPIHCGVFRRELLNQIRFETSLTAKEDWIFWLNLSAVKPKIAFYPTVGAIYRQHSTGMTKNLRKMAIDWLQARDHIKTYFPAQIGHSEIASINDHFLKFYFRHFWLKHGSSLPDSYFGEYFPIDARLISVRESK